MGSRALINVSVTTSIRVDSPTLLLKAARTPQPQLLQGCASTHRVGVIFTLMDGLCACLCVYVCASASASASARERVRAPGSCTRRHVRRKKEQARERKSSHSYPGGPEVSDLFLPGRSCFITKTHQPTHQPLHLDAA